MSVTHVIFDFDGVMVDTEAMYSEAADKALQQYGKRFSLQLKQGMMGAKRSESVPWLLKQVGLSEKVTFEQFDEAYQKNLEEALPKSPILPGVVKLVDHLLQHDIPVAICTGSSTDEFELKTKGEETKKLVSKVKLLVLSGDDPECKKGKPAPDPYLLTMKRCNPKPAGPEKCLVFEDSFNGARAGLAAGCNVVFIPQPQHLLPGFEKDIETLKKEHPTRLRVVLRSMSDFVPEEFGLPPFE